MESFQQHITQLLPAAAGVLTAYFVLDAVYAAYFHPLAKIPGPKSWAISQLPYIYHFSRGHIHEVLRDAHEKYGHVVRYGRDEVSFATNEAWKAIYGHKARGEEFAKDKRYYRQTPDASIITADREAHKRHRRLLAHPFSENALRSQEDIIKQYVDLFINGLAERSARNEVVDIAAWFNFATFDLIGDLAFGESFKCLETGEYHPWVSSILKNMQLFRPEHIIKRLSLTALTPWLVPPSLARGLREHLRLTEETARRRIAKKDMGRVDFMSHILKQNDTEKGMTEGEILANVPILVIAGSETTATILAGAMFYLLMHKNTYDRLVQEIRSTFKSEDEITITSVAHLQYLVAMFSEALRMYPPVPNQPGRVVPEGGAIVEGYTIPEKTSVVVSHWAAYNYSGNFRDPEVFDPERWLGNPYYADDHRDVVQPFSTGPRNCIGKNLAYAEMRLIMARLLWNFDISMEPGFENWFKDQESILIWVRDKLNVRLTKVVHE